MTVQRTKSWPVPPLAKLGDATGQYLQTLYRSLVENSSEGLQDFDTLKLANSPWIDVRNYPSFSIAIDAIGSTKTTLLIPNQQNVTADKTIPSNVCLFFMRGGFLNISDGATITVNGQIEAGLYQIFQWTGTGKVEFGGQYWNSAELYPEWWGAKGTGETVDTLAILAALVAASGYSKRGNIVRLLSTSYLTDLTLLIDADVTLKGCGWKNRTVLYLKDGSNCDMIRNVDFDTTNGKEHIQIEDIELHGNKAGQTATSNGINFKNVNFLTMKNVCVHDCRDDGIIISQKLDGTTLYTKGVYLDNVYSGLNGGRGFVFDNCPDFELIKPIAEWNGSHGIHINDSLAEAYQVLANTLMVQPHVEGNTGRGIYLENGWNCVLVSPYCWGGGEQTSASTHLDIGTGFSNVQIFQPTFQSSTPTYDIAIGANTQGLFLLGGLNANRASYAMSINDASSGKAFNLIFSQESWQVPTLLNSWADYGSPHETTGYFKDSFGIVHLKGLLKSGTIGQNMFVLPTGYRPSLTKHFVAISYDGASQIISRIMIDSSGGVNPVLGANTWFSIEGITFRI